MSQFQMNGGFVHYLETGEFADVELETAGGRFFIFYLKERESQREREKAG